jgi:hypothetical protein
LATTSVMAREHEHGVKPIFVATPPADDRHHGPDQRHGYQCRAGDAKQARTVVPRYRLEQSREQGHGHEEPHAEGSQAAVVHAANAQRRRDAKRQHVQRHWPRRRPQILASFSDPLQATEPVDGRPHMQQPGEEICAETQRHEACDQQRRAAAHIPEQQRQHTGQQATGGIEGGMQAGI